MQHSKSRVGTKKNASRIDVSKGKSIMAVLRALGEVVKTPIEIRYNNVELERLANLIPSLDGDSKVIMEASVQYHEAVVSTLQ